MVAPRHASRRNKLTDTELDLQASPPPPHYQGMKYLVMKRPKAIATSLKGEK